MKNSIVTPIIATLGRTSLKDSVMSAQREFENVIVVADGVDLDFDNLPKENVSYFKVGRKNPNDKYGGSAWNLGAYVATTPYISHLGDDDEYDMGAGEYMQNKINENPDVDIWITGLRYNNGTYACMTPGLFPGNVAAPTYKTELFASIPFGLYLINPSAPFPFNSPDYLDFVHVAALHAQYNLKIDWYCKDLYLVRPKLDGTHGKGLNS